jgi:hypothetical protein
MDKSQSASEYERSQGDRRAAHHPLPWAIIGGVLVAIFSLGGLFLGGKLQSDSTSLQLIEVMSPPMQMLGFATITATITMLSLLLTMLGLLHQAELGFNKEFYHLIERVSLIDTILLIISTLLLTVLAFPLTEANGRSTEQLATLMYYVLILVDATIVGLLVAAVLMLFDAIKSVIRTINVQNNSSE